MKRLLLVLSFLCAALPIAASAQSDAAYQPASSLVLEHIPSIPVSIAEKAEPYTESRAASLLDWSPAQRSLLISTRFASTPQVHQVLHPMGARTQLTFFPDRVSAAIYPPHTADWMLLVKDVGGAEFYQFYRFDPATGAITLITDGKSRNLTPVFRPDGAQLAFTSTRRTGNDVDIWIEDPREPASAKLLTQFSGGGIQVEDWSPDGKTIVAVDERSINDSTVYLIDAATGEKRAIAGGTEAPASWDSPHFAKDGSGLFVLTDKDSDFHRLCRLSLDGKLGACLGGKI